MSPNGLCQTCSEADRVISTFSFYPNLEQCPRISIEGRPTGHPSLSNGSGIYRETG